MRVRSFGKKLMASACAVALGIVAMAGLSGCSSVTDALGVVTNSDPSVALACKLPTGSTITEDTLTVGVNANNSPYGGKNSSGDLIGLDVDVASTLADSLGCKVKIVDVGSDGKKALSEGTVDIVMGCSMSGSDDTVSYSSAYLNDGVSLFCKVTDVPDSVAVDLTKEKTVLVQASTTAEVEMQDALGASSVTSTSTMKDAFDALENGDATYLAANAVIGDYYARNYTDITRIDFLSVNDVSPVYVASSSKNSELSTAVNDAMSSITTDGTLKMVASKWLGDQGSTLLPGALSVDDLPKTFTATGSSSKGSEKSSTASDDSSAKDSESSSTEDE